MGYITVEIEILDCCLGIVRRTIGESTVAERSDETTGITKKSALVGGGSVGTTSRSRAPGKASIEQSIFVSSANEEISGISRTGV